MPRLSPRPQGRGTVEARSPASGSKSKANHLRAHRGAASLKWLPPSGWLLPAADISAPARARYH